MSTDSAVATRSREGTPPSGSGARALLFGVAGFGVLILAWYLVWYSGLISRSLFPRPDQVAQAAWTGFTERELARDMGVSIMRVLAGVSIGTGAAIPVGFLLAWYRPLRYMFDPLVSFFRTMSEVTLVATYLQAHGKTQDAAPPIPPAVAPQDTTSAGSADEK